MGDRPGDWPCSNCGAIVFATKSQCFKCGTMKPGVTAGPGGSAFGGGGRPGDWVCPKCYADVFASKSQCFKCGTAKPADAGLPPKEEMSEHLRDAPEGKCQGMVTRWDEAGGFGFIKPISPSGGDDVFVNRATLGGTVGTRQLVEGGIVFFRSEPSDIKGRIAIEISGPGVVEGEGCRAAKVNGMQHGLVARWNQERGFGFISPSVGGLDVFVQRDAFGGQGMLIEGCACFFEVSMGTGARGKHGARAQNVSGPALINKAEEFKKGDLVVYRDGKTASEKNEHGESLGWVLEQGHAAIVIRVVGDELILDNGKCNSAPLHAALWWRKTFIVLEVGSGELPKRSRLLKTLGCELSRRAEVTRVDRDSAGRQCGLREGMSVRWIDGEDVYNDREAEDAFALAREGRPFEIVLLMRCAMTGRQPARREKPLPKPEKKPEKKDGDDKKDGKKAKRSRSRSPRERGRDDGDRGGRRERRDRRRRSASSSPKRVRDRRRRRRSSSASSSVQKKKKKRRRRKSSSESSKSPIRYF